MWKVTSLLAFLLVFGTNSLSTPQPPNCCSRRAALVGTTASFVGPIATLMCGWNGGGGGTAAAAATIAEDGNVDMMKPTQQQQQQQQQLLGLSDTELRQIVTSDVLDRQFLVTGDVTRSIYKPTATFTDEIDTYSMDQWIKGTQRLFVGAKSQVRLVGNVNVSPQQVEFRFDEDLMFNIPFKPIVSLTGTVILTRDESGFITAYREFWDQDVATVLKTARF